METKKEVKQTSKLKEVEGGFELTFENYGNVESQTLKQFFTKEQLKEQYKQIKTKKEQNKQMIDAAKKQLIEFKDDKEAYRILELVRYANVHTQKPLTDSELLFIANYPDIASKIMTVTPANN